MKVAVIFGTRPDAIKLAAVCRALVDCPDIEYRGINTGQHHELMPSIMARFGVPPARELGLMRPGQSLVELETRILCALPHVLRDESPDMVMVQGDTATAAMAAWAAFHEGFPVAHVEAGLRTYRPRFPFPEETFRRTIATFSAWNFAPSLVAAQNLKREMAPGRVVVTGNPVVDTLERILSSPPPDTTPWPDKSKPYRVVATIHRRENYPYLDALFGAFDRLARQPQIECFIPLHPHPEVVWAANRRLNNSPVRIIDPMDYEDWIGFIQTADVVISDSGGVQEEAPILGIPLLIAREETERPEIVAGGHGILVGHDPDTIVSMTEEILRGEIRLKVGSPYGDGHAAQRIVYHLLHPEASVDPYTGHPDLRLAEATHHPFGP